MIHVIAVDGRVVCDDKAALAGVRRYVGRVFSGSAPGEIVTEGSLVEASLHIRRALKRGDLLPGDADAARWAGLPVKKQRKRKGSAASAESAETETQEQ